MSHDQEPLAQPLLPRISITWFFVVVAVVAIALFIIRAADQGQALATGMVFAVIFFGVTGFLAGLTFMIAFSLGAIEQAVTGENDEVASPFIEDTLPDQIIPPKKTLDNT